MYSTEKVHLGYFLFLRERNRFELVLSLSSKYVNINAKLALA